MKNTSKLNWARFFSFLGIVLLLTILVNFVPKQERKLENIYWPYFVEKVPENSLDFVFLGNSHAQCAFIPEIIDDILHTESFNLITPGESIQLTQYEYREVLRRQNPMAVIIETGVIYSGKNQSNIEPFQFSFFDALPFSLRKLAYIHGFFSTGNLIKYYFPYIMNHSDWKTPYKPLNSLAKAIGGSGQPIALSNRGYYRISVPLLSSDEIADENTDLESCSVSDLDERLTSAEDILRFSQTQASKLIFLETPLFPNRNKSCGSQTEALFARYETLNHQLLNKRAPALLWFHDSGHLTQFGAVIASIETARLLSEELDLPLDQQTLAYFESYQFLDYSLSINERAVQVLLTPLDETVSNNLKYQWQVYQDGQSIHEEEIQGGNEFNFSLPDACGEYVIKVQIQNTAGDYVLEGEFPVVLDSTMQGTEG